jgi:hypothetical protein
VPVLHEYGSTGELQSHGKTEEPGGKSEPVPLCPSQIPCGLLWDRTGSLNLFIDNNNTAATAADAAATTATTNNNNNNNLVPLQVFNFGRYIQHPIL